MPRFGLSCSDRVLRVPKLTSLRIVASIFFALISETIFGMSGLPRSPGRETFGRDDFGLGEFAEFCGSAPAGLATKVGMIMPISNTTRATAIFERNDLMRSAPKNLNLRTRETLSTQTLKGNELGRREVLPIGFVARDRLGFAICGFEKSSRVFSAAGRTFKARGHRRGHDAWIGLDVCRRRWGLHMIGRERRTDQFRRLAKQ